MKYRTLVEEKMRNPAEIFRNEDGAIDLASIMVGIIVIGLIGGVIAATVFAVIPWAQDSAAKHQLESIHTAQNAHFGFTAANLSSLPAGTQPNTFADSEDLELSKLLIQTNKYCTVAKADGKKYGAYSLSATGKIWASDNQQTKPFVFNGTLPSACPELIEESTRVGSTTPDGTTTYPYAGGSGVSGGSAAEDISSPGMGDGTRSSSQGTITGDGSGSYFTKSTAWLSSYGPVMNHTLPSPVLDLTGWTYDGKKDARVIFTTNGSHSGVGGSWIYLVHMDVSCWVPSTKTFYREVTAPSAILKGPYTSSPGQNSSSIAASCGPYAPSDAILSQVLVRQATDEEWANYSLGYLDYVYTLPNLSEGWTNPYVPQE